MNKNQERRCRQALRADIAGSSYWQDLAPTVDLVPSFLVEAWADLCNGWDDDAMVVWSDLHDAFSLPRSLDSSLRRLRESQPLIQLLGEPFVNAFAIVKEAEGEVFMQVISSWEREHLLLNV